MVIRISVLYAASLWGIRMDKENAKIRNKLKTIESVRDFEELLSETMLSEEEKQMLRLHYKERRTLQYIADALGMSESNVKKMHRKALTKIRKMF